MLLCEIFRSVKDKHEYDPHTMAAKLGVATNTMWRYLRGTVSPSTEVLARLAQLGNLDFPSLLAQKATEAEARRLAAKEKAIRIKAGKAPEVARRDYKPRTLSPILKLEDMKHIHDMLKEILAKVSTLEKQSHTHEHVTVRAKKKT